MTSTMKRILRRMREGFELRRPMGLATVSWCILINLETGQKERVSYMPVRNLQARGRIRQLETWEEALEKGFMTWELRT